MAKQHISIRWANEVCKKLEKLAAGKGSFFALANTLTMLGIDSPVSCKCSEEIHTRLAKLQSTEAQPQDPHRDEDIRRQKEWLEYLWGAHKHHKELNTEVWHALRKTELIGTFNKMFRKQIEKETFCEKNYAETLCKNFFTETPNQDWVVQ